MLISAIRITDINNSIATYSGNLAHFIFIAHSAYFFAIPTIIRGSFHKYATKRLHFVNLQNVKMLKYTFLYSDKYFTRPAIHVWCKKFTVTVEKVLLMRNDLQVAVLFRRPTQRSHQFYTV